MSIFEPGLAGHLIVRLGGAIAPPTRLRRVCRVAPTLLVLVASLALMPGCGGADETVSSPSVAGGPPGPGRPSRRACARGDRERMLADLEGRIVTQHEFLAFLATARGPGYRPATPAEAVRLVRAYLRTLLERGPPVSLTAASGPAPAAVAVADRTSRIRVSDSELRGFVGRHPHLRGEGGPEPYAALRDRLRRHRVERASRWMLDTLLDESAFTIEADAIEALVCAQPTAAPPLPPGFAPASGMPGAVSR